MHKKMMLPVFSLCPLLLSAQEKKNIVLILGDDIGYECIGAYGSALDTPYLDMLAREGILYTNCHSQPLSTPSRVELMTGKYNFRNYVEFGYMNPERTFANVARDCGYSTCMVGKWQLGNAPDLPLRFGFDQYCLWQLARGRQDGAGDRYADACIECNTASYDRNIDLYGPDVFNEYAADFIEENRNNPFLLYYSCVLVHSPFYPVPGSESWQNVRLRKKDDLRNFPEMVRKLDCQIGKLVCKLKELNLYDKTVLIFIGDNGTHRSVLTPMKDGREIQGGKGRMTDAGTHVPMIVRYPSTKGSGTVRNSLVDFTDFYPTIAQIAGARRKEYTALDGHSLLPQFQNKSNAYERKWVFCHFDPLVNGIPDVNKSGRFIRDEKFKLYHDGRFYNVKEDVLELVNLTQGSCSEEAERHRRYLSKQLKRFPYWKPGMSGMPRKGDYEVATKLK